MTEICFPNSHEGCKLVLDWHNYGFSIMALAHPASHPLVKLSKLVEDFIGSRVPLAFCVSKAMKKDLESRLGLNATVLYDRPPESFRPISVEERHQLFEKLEKSYPEIMTEQHGDVRILKAIP
jgi:beta-1,4-mannosyltransferase